MHKVKKGAIFTDDIIDLRVIFQYDGKGKMGNVPFYGCFLFFHNTEIRIGEITLRLGDINNKDIYYDSNIGYGINSEYRGKGYAGRACNLIKKVAIIENLTELSITCNVENAASIRVLEKIGAKYDATFEVLEKYRDKHDAIPKRRRYFIKL